ncbi:MAG TPA: DUF1343 domain-containing protein [bacterium]|nr:DUF1343 domain-containing protein [bacterium]HPN42329.1 DUF1343 domain-containing protein [bacterium]
MQINKYLLLVFMFLALTARAQNEKSIQVKPGIDVLLQEKMDLIRGKRLGLITNPTGITANLTGTIDTLYRHPDVNLVALFGPEHGVRGNIIAGKQIENFRDEQTGLPVYSLYGKQKKPTPEMLKDIDVLVFDIQDIGSRAYTYINTMAYAIQAAQENHIPILVLDRPNPLGGELVEGPMLEPAFKSFIGLYEIPYIYGLTIGELAAFINTEFNINADLTVIPMQGWRRSMTFADTGLPWAPTSPHVPQAQTPFFVATTGCLGELQTIHGGVGYTLPFELLGGPWIDGRQLADSLNALALPGVHFRPLYYSPFYFSFQNQQIQGVQIHITDTKAYRPMLTQIHILVTLHKLYPQQELFPAEHIAMFDRAMGTDRVRLQILENDDADVIYQNLTEKLANYLTTREKYLLY